MSSTVPTASILECPNCGAALSARAAERARGELWPCLYCGAIVRVAVAATGKDEATVERTVPSDVMARVRERVLAGKSDEAVAMCESSGVSREGAVAAVDALVASVSTRVILSQTLNAVGWVLVLGSLAVAAMGAWLAAAGGPVGLPVGAVLALFGGLNFLVLLRGVSTSLRFLVAPRATAVVRSVAEIGTRSVGRVSVRVFSLAVDVRPESGAAFHGQLVVPTREQSVHKVFVGAEIPVRWSRGDPTWLRYDGGSGSA